MLFKKAILNPQNQNWDLINLFTQLKPSAAAVECVCLQQAQEAGTTQPNKPLPGGVLAPAARVPVFTENSCFCLLCFAQLDEGKALPFDDDVIVRCETCLPGAQVGGG